MKRLIKRGEYKEKVAHKYTSSYRTIASSSLAIFASVLLQWVCLECLFWLDHFSFRRSAENNCCFLDFCHPSDHSWINDCVWNSFIRKWALFWPIADLIICVDHLPLVFCTSLPSDLERFIYIILGGMICEGIDLPGWMITCMTDQLNWMDWWMNDVGTWSSPIDACLLRVISWSVHVIMFS